jgi:uncharacterized protein
VSLKIYLRFYGELNDFLPQSRKGRHIALDLQMPASAKDVIEALGVPHTEVDLILLNGESIDFSRLVHNQDRISIYPVFRSIDISSLTRVRPVALIEKGFVLDSHLGRLAAYLRLCGFDTLYRNDYRDEELAEVSAQQNRILLIRERGLLKRAIVTHGYFMREIHPQRQLVEVLRRFDLFGAIAAFSRCMHCNVLLHAAPLDVVIERLPKKTRQSYYEFNICPSCGRVYWRGTHYARMKRLIDGIAEFDSATTGASCL